MDKYLEHLTLSTGYSRRSFRSEVGNDAIAALSPWLSHALDSGDIEPLPGLGDRYGAVVVKDAGLIVTIYSIEGVHPAGLVKFGVANRSRQSKQCWRVLAAVAGGGSTLLPPPAVPWCAAVLYPEAATHLEDLTWLGDFERCVAWTWIEQGGKAK